MTPTELRRRYEATRYRIDGAGTTVEVRIGEASPDLDALLAREGAKEGVFVTAANPRSRPLSDEENARRNAALDEAARPRRALPHLGAADEGDWAERGLFVLDLPCRSGVALAERFEQYAIVHCVLGRAPVLVFTRIAEEDADGSED